jgi:pyruvate formate lyase activating enzyme
MRNKPPTPGSTLTRCRTIAIDNGVHHVYTGNVHDSRGGSTYCHSCGEVLVGRDWYQLTSWKLDDDGRCSACGEPCHGRFAGPPGDWGPRRLPVRLRDFEKSF